VGVTLSLSRHQSAVAAETLRHHCCLSPRRTSAHRSAFSAADRISADDSPVRSAALRIEIAFTLHQSSVIGGFMNKRYRGSLIQEK
jgi:hypothetical protein